MLPLKSGTFALFCLITATQSLALSPCTTTQLNSSRQSDSGGYKSTPVFLPRFQDGGAWWVAALGRQSRTLCLPSSSSRPSLGHYSSFQLCSAPPMFRVFSSNQSIYSFLTTLDSIIIVLWLTPSRKSIFG